MLNDLKVLDNETALVSLDSQLKFAETIAKSGLVPKGLQTKDQVFVAVQWGKELGLSPMVALNNIAVVNGKPTLSADIMHAIARKSPRYHGVQWLEQSEKKAECIIEMINPDGSKEQVRGTYSIEDAERAGLTTKDNWKKYPQRMLKHRALSFALRDAFPDILSGLLSADEAYEISEEENIRNITPPPIYDDFDKAPEPVKALATAEDFD